MILFSVSKENSFFLIFSISIKKILPPSVTGIGKRLKNESEREAIPKKFKKYEGPKLKKIEEKCKKPTGPTKDSVASFLKIFKKRKK